MFACTIEEVNKNMTVSKNNTNEKITAIINKKSGTRINCPDYGFKPNTY